MKASIIIIGNEVLSGKTLDTNSHFIANQLQAIGISVAQIFTISDEIEAIKTTLSKAIENTDMVFTTGGLGPTKDDRTKIAFQDFFKDELTFNSSIYEHLRLYLERKGRSEILGKNKSQAEVLSKAKVFLNKYGTAPCQMINQEGKLVFCLPGVPFEVKPLMQEQIIPYLKKQFSLPHIIHKIVTVMGIPESILANQLEDWENALPQHIQLAYLPTGTTIKLRLTTTGKDKELLSKQLSDEVEKIKPIIGKSVISYDGENTIALLKNILINKGWTISTAESCTAGEIARLLTTISGSSNYFVGGVIPYDYHQKMNLLGVQSETIQHKTVVSEEVAKEMAEGCQKLFNTDIAIATTGVAGPSTDEFNNEIGLIHYAIKVGAKIYPSQMYLPHFDREDFVEYVSQKIIERLIKIINE